MTGLTSYHLKLIAAVTMLLDHIGAMLYPEVSWLRVVGRISFPLFVWLLVQGEARTKNVWRYGLRLGLLALVSQPFYQVALDVRDPNVLFLLLVGLGCLRVARKVPEIAVPIWLVAAIASQLLNISYGSYGIALILLIRYFRSTNLLWWLAWIALHLISIWPFGTFQLPAIAVPLLFISFNGQRGPKARWFYSFYPGHLALLTLIQAWPIVYGRTFLTMK